MRVLVLGIGMIGSAAAYDLSRDTAFDVTAADRSPERLSQVAARARVRTVDADLSQPDVVRALAAGHDLVIGAMPSALGYQTLQAVIAAGRPCVDISFMPEDVLALDPAAHERGVTVVADCGVAPGLSNMMVGYAAGRLTRCERVDIAVGGLPRAREWPYEYKAGFAPSDVIEEYVRPARVVESGREVVRPALSDVQLVEVPGVGALEAFLTDGLRSLVRTIPAEQMQERTLRYPGHAHLMRALRDGGFFSRDPIDVQGHGVRPLDVTSALLFARWTYADGEPDLTAMRVLVEGRDGASAVRYRWNVIDFYDPSTGLRSMSRTTAFSATSAARLIASGAFSRPGVCAPEAIGAQPGLLERVLSDLRQRGIRIDAEEER